MADAVQDEMVYKLELLNDFRAWLRRRYPLSVKGYRLHLVTGTDDTLYYHEHPEVRGENCYGMCVRHKNRKGSTIFVAAGLQAPVLMHIYAHEYRHVMQDCAGVWEKRSAPALENDAHVWGRARFAEYYAEHFSKPEQRAELLPVVVEDLEEWLFDYHECFLKYNKFRPLNL